MASVSQELGYKATQTLHYAVHEQANRIGLPLTHWVTINFANTVIAPEQAVPLFGKLRTHHFNKWALRPCKGKGTAFQPTYAYVFENARDDTEEIFDEIGPGLPHNVHVHWAVHLPGNRVFDFEQRIWEWLDQRCGAPSAANAIKIKPIEDDLGGTEGIREYMLKGTNEKVGKEGFGVKRVEPQGAIIGRRSGVSLNLGPTARRELDKLYGIRRQRPRAA